MTSHLWIVEFKYLTFRAEVEIMAENVSKALILFHEKLPNIERSGYVVSVRPGYTIHRKTSFDERVAETLRRGMPYVTMDP